MKKELTRIIFKTIIGRTPSMAAIEHYETYSWPMLVNLLLNSKEFKHEDTGLNRRENVLINSELQFLNEKIGVPIDGAKKDITIDLFFNECFLPYYQKVLSGATIEFIQSKSLPRSGHHFLISLLTKYFDSDLYYCEGHSPKGCCKSNPCLKPFNKDMSNKLMIQKSHDFGLKDEKNNEFIYLIQHRSPIGRIQSNFELALKSSKGLYTDTKESFEKFAINDAEYSIDFYNKWFDPNDGLQKIFIQYEELVFNTEDALNKIIMFITGEAAVPEKLEIAAENKKVKVNTLNSPKETRKASEHRFFSREFAETIEKKISSGIKHKVSIPFEFIG
ncbi:hypothetical protein [Pseudoalteromonas sp. SSM20]|uniref:hypothetical protein n=1 Tax=Pseudoalteromonas sp. SSM20 TaxID=3139394 RepID=UPI003BAD248F